MRRFYFLPRYIASLKYYEKLFPALIQQGISPAFLLFEDAGMVAYCKNRQLPFDDRFAAVPLGNIPFVSHVLRELSIFKGLDEFLDDTRPSALVTEPAVSQRVRALFARAQRRGIRTSALQWALHASIAARPSASIGSLALALRDKHSSLVRGILYKLYLFLLTSIFRGFDLVRGGDHFMLRGTHVDELGVIDETAREALVRDGWEERHTHVVGYAEFTLAAELAEHVRKDPQVRAELVAKYGLMPGRKHVLVLSTPFHSGRDAVFLDHEGQRRYFAEVIEDIRTVLGTDTTDVLFKLHPREQNIYGSLEEQGVRVYHNEADLAELVAISDLYIAHPLTAANLIVQASKTPALFINFTPLAYMNEGKRIYGLRAISTTHGEFRDELRQYQLGKLPLQYDASVDTHALEKIVAFLTAR